LWLWSFLRSEFSLKSMGDKLAHAHVGEGGLGFRFGVQFGVYADAGFSLHSVYGGYTEIGKESSPRFKGCRQSPKGPKAARPRP
jgi:hypothetical protein